MVLNKTIFAGRIEIAEATNVYRTPWADLIKAANSGARNRTEYMAIPLRTDVIRVLITSRFDTSLSTSLCTSLKLSDQSQAGPFSECQPPECDALLAAVLSAWIGLACLQEDETPYFRRSWTLATRCPAFAMGAVCGTAVRPVARALPPSGRTGFFRSAIASFAMRISAK